MTCQPPSAIFGAVDPRPQPGSPRTTVAPPWLDEREQRAWRAFTRLRIELGAALSPPPVAAIRAVRSRVRGAGPPQRGARRSLRAFELGRTLQWEKSRLSHQLTRMAQARAGDAPVLPERPARIVRGADRPGRAAIEAAAPGHVEDVRALFIDLLTDEPARPARRDRRARPGPTRHRAGRGLRADPDG
jgi:hypothetical protein